MSETTQTTQSTRFKRRLTGTVVSDKGEKTIIVSVNRKFQHSLYGKFVNKSKRYHAHDDKNEAKVGDFVTIIESRPYSKLKKWELSQIKVSKQEVNV